MESFILHMTWNFMRERVGSKRRTMAHWRWFFNWHIWRSIWIPREFIFCRLLYLPRLLKIPTLSSLLGGKVWDKNRLLELFSPDNYVTTIKSIFLPSEPVPHYFFYYDGRSHTILLRVVIKWSFQAPRPPSLIYTSQDNILIRAKKA